jgi:hypothetical protein
VLAGFDNGHDSKGSYSVACYAESSTRICPWPIPHPWQDPLCCRRLLGSVDGLPRISSICALYVRERRSREH